MRRLIAPTLAALLCLATIAAVQRAGADVRVGTWAWRRLVRGPTLDGVLYAKGAASVFLPGIDRSRPGEVILDAATLSGGTAVLEVRVDSAAPLLVAVAPGRVAVIPLAARGEPGVRLDLHSVRGTDVPRLGAVRARGLVSWPGAASLAAAAALLTAAGRRLGGLCDRAAVALAMVAAALCTFPAVPLAAWMTARVTLVALASLVAGGLLGAIPRAGRTAFVRAALVVSALVVGVGMRLFFLPSTGSWDTAYWKAWTAHADEAGLARAYGPPESSPGVLLAQARGREPVWMVRADGRDFPIDYPPGALAAWITARRAVRTFAPGLAPAEADSVAVKLPAVLGDVCAVAVLLWAFRDRPWSAVRLAALYWALPPSWLSSAVLGYLDGAYVVFVLVSLLLAGQGRGAAAGATLALAALVKPTALVAAPAAAVVLRGRGLGRALGAGLAVVALALVPYALGGTLLTCLVHVWRIVLQQRLSSGYANPWWAVGWALSGGGGGQVPYASIDEVPFAGLIGLAVFAGLATAIVRSLSRRSEPAAAAAAGAALFAAYGMAAVGVHVNHPHALVLLFLAGSAATAGWTWAPSALVATYTLNIVLLEGLGRFHGERYLAAEAVGRALAALRTAPGFDLTLLIVPVNVVAMAAVLTGAARGWRRPGAPAPTS